MLRKRSKSVGSKQNMVSDSTSLPSPTPNNPNKATLSSHLLFRSFSSKGFSDSEAAMSPTSILETKHLSSFASLLYSDRQQKKPPPDACSSFSSTKEPIGLGIVDALNEDKANKDPDPDRRMVLFGSQLKIQIPSICPSVELPSSPIEFGIKNKDSQLALFSPSRRSLGHEVHVPSPRVVTGVISVSEMELSEDYTCVISRGPNPKTTHIFDNCVVESCGVEFPVARKEKIPINSLDRYPSDDFLAFCHACKKILGQETDIFIYRGEKAFCSSECRNNEILVDEELDNR